MTVVDRFLKYVTFATQSDEESGITPSTSGQRVFAEALVKELETLGLEDISLDDNCYLMATLPSNMGNNEVPTIGFISHLDTSPDMSGEGVKPRIVSYAGGDIVLNEAENIVLSPRMFPEMEQYIGQDLIVTDGTTLLGADDKAGVAAIISAVAYLKEHPEIKHGKIRIGFTPDEEIGAGADHFDVEKFGCEFAYTVDGGEIGELEYENFNASSVDIKIIGKSVHPGSAYNVMINAASVATEFNSMVPQNEVPEKTKGYEGFYMLTSISGEVDEAKLSYILRDFDLDGLNQRKAKIEEITKTLQQKYGEDRIIVDIKDSYYNMKEKIEPVMYIIDLAKKAMKDADIEPKIVPIRGGTDGARISYMGIPTPNLFTGGYNFHGYYEYAVAEEMEKAKEVIINIVKNNK